MVTFIADAYGGLLTYFQTVNAIFNKFTRASHQNRSILYRYTFLRTSSFVRNVTIGQNIQKTCVCVMVSFYDVIRNHRSFENS